MKPRTQNLIGCGLLLALIFFGFIGYSLYSAFTNFQKTEDNSELPQEIREPRILTGKDFLQKTEIFKLERTGVLRSFFKNFRPWRSKEKHQKINNDFLKNVVGFNHIRVIGDEIIAVGGFGGYVFDLNCQLKREILFENQKEQITIFGIEISQIFNETASPEIIEMSKNNYALLSRHQAYGLNVYDQNGNAIFKYGNKKEEFAQKKTWLEDQTINYVMNVVVDDLDGDGKSEFVVLQNIEGIRALNIQGQELWFQPIKSQIEYDDSQTRNLKIIDLDGDGKTELVENQGKKINIREKKTGNILKTLEISLDGKIVLYPENQTKNAPPLFFKFIDNEFFISDLSGKTVLEIDPFSKYSNTSPNNSNSKFKPNLYPSNIGPILIRLQKDKPKSLAVILDYFLLSRSIFLVYDEKGTLVYHEILPENAQTIAALPNSDGTESILIGGKDTIWKFSTK